MAAAIILRRTASRVIGGGGNQFRGRYFSTAVNQSRLIIPSTSLSSVRKFSSSQSVKVSDLSDVKKVSLDESINNLYSKLESIKLELESIRNGKELPKAVDATDEGVTERLPNESYSDDDSDSVVESDSDDDSDTDGEPEAHDEFDTDGETETEPESEAIQDNDSISPGNGEHEKYSPFIEGIDSEIAQAVNFSYAADEGMKFPEGFPFKLEEDRPGTTSIVLSREYEGERIEVSVQNPTVYLHIYYDDSAAIIEYETLKDTAFSMDLSVRVSCGNSNMTKVELNGTAYKDRFCIYKAMDPADGIDNEGVHLSTLDKGLQSEFHKYLEIRGIKPCTTNYIYQYMLGKANREKLSLLRKFKNLV